MNLQENIQRIKGLMTEDKEESKREMIRSLGLADAVKYFGNYYTIEPYLKVIDKIDFIKEKVSEIDNSGFGLIEIDEEPIHYDENENEIRQIEYLTKNKVFVDVYDSDMNSHLGEFSVSYEGLPVHIIEELVEVLLNH